MRSVRGESWRVELDSWRVEWRDRVESLVSGYNIIGRCGFEVVEVLMWYGRDPASPEAAPRQAGVVGYLGPRYSLCE